MDTLRQTYNRLFRKEQIVENDVDHEAQRVIELLQQRQRAPLDGDLDDEDARNATGAYNIGEEGPINYRVELLNFMDRNGPKGFADKFQTLMPFLAASLISWPSYWLWRGYNWQTRRRSERIGVYIHRTFQHAKVMQLAILSLGLLMATIPRISNNSLDVQDISYESNNQDDSDDD